MKKLFFGRMKTRPLVFCAMIAAVYTALCLLLPMLSYGALQVRLSEALTLLPVFSPYAVWGVTVGCLLSNIIGAAMGTNILGWLDVGFGTVATLLAAILSYMLRKVRWRNLPVLSVLPPVVINAVVVGGELSFATMGTVLTPVFWASAGWVALGQLVACGGLGLALVATMEKTGLDGTMRGL